MGTRIKYVLAGVVLALVVAGFLWSSTPETVTGASRIADVTGAARIAQDLRSVNEAMGKVLSPGPDIAVDVRKQRLGSAFKTLKALDALVAKDTFDLDAVAAQEGHEPARLFQWVRDHTGSVPYRGSLRGARGTLMDRQGNSLDRALLLAGLLRSSGVKTRLAHATLNEQQVAEIARPSGAAAPPVEGDDNKDRVLSELDAFAKDAGIDAVRVRELLQQSADQAASARERVRGRVERQTTVLAQGLAGVTTPAGADADDDRAALQDHWWVQWQNGSAWSDLDPDVSRAGSTVAPATEFINPDALPADEYHVITARVVVEQWDGSRLLEKQSVSIEVRASDALGQTIRLRHVPIDWPAGDMKAPDTVKQSALSQREWLPVFMVGTREVKGASVQDTGDLNEKPGSPTRFQPAQGLADAFGGGEDTKPGVLTAEWIEYEIRVPGRSARVIRREVFDILGGASRSAGRAPELTDTTRLSRALNLLNETEILVLPCQLSSAYVSHLTASRLVDYEGVLGDLVSTGTPPPVDRFRDLEPLPGVLHSLAVLRGAWSRSPGSVYIREPNILSTHVFPHVGPTGTVRLDVAMDIVANEVAPHGGSPGDRFMARIEQGVLDTNLEAVLIGAASGALDQNEWVPVRSTTDLDRLSLDADARARLESDVNQGFVLLVQKGPGTTGAGVSWWRINARTGDTLSLGNRGWGQATVEYSFLRNGAFAAGACIIGSSMQGLPSAKSLIMCGMLGAAFVGAFFVSFGMALGTFTGGQIMMTGGAIMLVSASVLGYGLGLSFFSS